MQVSHSRVECWAGCPYRYKLRYLDDLQTIKADNADNALYLGTALHTALEKGLNAAVTEYYMQFPIIGDAQVNEMLKLELLIPKAAALIPKGENEVLIEDEDFKGFIDLLAPVTGFHGEIVPDVYDIYDFKYSNNVSHYKDSVQVHLYKYFFEKLNPEMKIRKIFYLCVPKVNSKQKKTEPIWEYRRRIREECKTAEPKLIEVEYDQSKVVEWLFQVKHMTEASEFPKIQGWLCKYCEYYGYCQEGNDVMNLPKNERRSIEQVQKKVVWLYGAPFSGKTTFANEFPDPLMLNTDGNIKFVDAPYLSIKDQVEVTGRMTKRTKGWEIFKDIISELEKKKNTFKTIIVDLLEDVYEQCRLYMCDQMGITHESDDSFRAWDKVRTEFLSTLKRLINLDYENIVLISHEDTSKDITKKGGDRITAIKPNLQEKIANKVAGMVDIVARVIADGNLRTLSFKTNEVIFGGGRLLTKTDKIPLDYNAFLDVYAEANAAAANAMTKESSKRAARKQEKPAEEPVEAAEAPVPDKAERRKRKEDVADSEQGESSISDKDESDKDAKAAPQTDVTSASHSDGNWTSGGGDKDDSAPKEIPAEKPKVRTRKRREN